jgi:hypothetical protein
VSRDVVFDENLYPFARDTLPSNPQPTEDALLLPEPDTSEPICTDTASATDRPASCDVSGAAPVDSSLHGVHAPPYVDRPAIPRPGAAPDGPVGADSPPRTPPPTAHGQAHDDDGPASSQSSPASIPMDESPAGSSPIRSSSPPTHDPAPVLPARRQHKPVRLFDGIIRYDPKKRAFAAEPTSHVDALAEPVWKAAMDDEYRALSLNHT